VVLSDNTAVLGEDVDSDLVSLDSCDDVIGFDCLTNSYAIRKLDLKLNLRATKDSTTPSEMESPMEGTS
jgi:hypothetical protein